MSSFGWSKLKTISENDHATKTRKLYNLSHCLLQTGKKAKAHGCLKHFFNEFEKFDFSKLSAATKANYYFCAGLAYKELGLIEKAGIMRLKSEEQISILKSDMKVFSPLDYESISVVKFQKQLESSFKTSIVREN